MRTGFRNHRHMIMASGVCVATVIALFLIVDFWPWLSGGESGSTTVRNLALVLAGVIAVPLAAWRSFVADRQSRIAQQGLLNERYQKGGEMLGSEVLSVRLAGIYALQRLAAEHPEQYHLQVMRLFCAFVRLPTKDQSPEAGRTLIQSGTLPGIRQDVESVLEAIGHRNPTQKALERKAEFRLDLRGADLSKSQILDADLSKTMFSHANLSGVQFANTDLKEVSFRYADLSKSWIHEAKFTGADLAYVNLSGAMLQGAEMIKLNLHSVGLSGANLERAILTNSILQDADLTDAWLNQADLTGATFLRADLSRARLDRVDLTGAVLLDANLAGANFTGAILSGVRFSSGGPQPAKGLTQTQLDQAQASSDNPPNLLNMFDAETGEQLVWRGKLLDEDAQIAC